MPAKKADTQKQSVNSVLTAAWGVYKENVAPFIVATLALTAMVFALVLVAVVPFFVILFSNIAHNMSGTEAIVAMFSNLPSMAFSFGWLFVFFVISFVINCALEGGMVAMAVEALRTGKTSYNTMFSVGRSRWKTFTGLTLINLAIMLAIFSVFLLPGVLMMMGGRPIAGAVLLMACIFALLLVMMVVGVLLGFGLTATVADGLPAVKGFKAGLKFGRANFKTALLVLLVFAGLYMGAALLNLLTSFVGTLLEIFVLVPLQLLSVAALYLGAQKRRAVKRK